jgi:uncharacterized protein YndB with AHSA1/START domain
MGQQHFEFEYEIKASPKVLYPYISSASGLQQWFAEKVTVKNAELFIFNWDDETHTGHLVQNKVNKSVKFDFSSAEQAPLSAFIEIKLDVSELTNATYLKIYDSASTFKSPDDAQELWDYLTDKLKEIVGS